jgi:6-phosphogluconate dehydrogenase
MLSKDIAMKLQNCQDSMRLAVKTGIETGIPLPVMMSSLSYFDSFRRGWLPANLIQAQRDYFGAHTYERTDRAGSFHTQWKQEKSL